MTWTERVGSEKKKSKVRIWILKEWDTGGGDKKKVGEHTGRRKMEGGGR